MKVGGMMKTRRLGLRKYKKLLRNVDGKMPQQNQNSSFNQGILTY